MTLDRSDGEGGSLFSIGLHVLSDTLACTDCPVLNLTTSNHRCDDELMLRSFAQYLYCAKMPTVRGSPAYPEIVSEPRNLLVR